VKPFETLTHLGRGRQLRPYAIKLLKDRFGIQAVTLQQVAESVNIVFRAVTQDQKRCVLRLTPPGHFHDRCDVDSEIAWIDSLCQAGIGVPHVIQARNGETVISMRWDGIPGQWHCVVFEWIQARELATCWRDANIYRYGQLLAQLHVAGARFTPPKGFRVRSAATVFPHCDPAFEKAEPFVLFDKIPKDLVPPARRKLFERALDLAQGEISRLFESGTPQPIHNDLHPWNVMINRFEIFAIDFENMLMGFPVQDVGTTLNYFRNYVKDEMPYEDRLAVFRKGYESVRPWPEEFPGQVQLMSASHRLMLCNFYAAHRDPEYREFATIVFKRVEARIKEDLAVVEMRC